MIHIVYTYTFISIGHSIVGVSHINSSLGFLIRNGRRFRIAITLGLCCGLYFVKDKSEIHFCFFKRIGRRCPKVNKTHIPTGFNLKLDSFSALCRPVATAFLRCARDNPISIFNHVISILRRKPYVFAISISYCCFISEICVLRSIFTGHLFRKFHKASTIIGCCKSILCFINFCIELTSNFESVFIVRGCRLFIKDKQRSCAINHHRMVHFSI